jgi:sulfide:quinone oxidoreductase
MTARPRVAILGGGFAGLETAFTLRRRLGDRVDLTLISDSADFLFKPNTIYIPFGKDEQSLHIPIARPAARQLIRFHHGTVGAISGNRVEITDGSRVPYDFVVVATGAAMNPDEVPGLAEHAETIWTPKQMRRLGQRFLDLESSTGVAPRRVTFLVPPGNKCAGPLYELIFMLETWLRRRGLRDRVELTWTTYENSFVQAFGPRLHDLVSDEFDRRGIDGHTGAVVSKVAQDEVLYADGSRRGHDLLVAFPPHVAAAEYPGLPADDRGFLHTDPATRLVSGTENVYAPGDAGDFPVKQAFLAFLQADAVADDIAARVDHRLAAAARWFEPTSMCVMEMFDTAAFAQVPLQTTGDPAAPVRVAPGAGSAYRVGESPVWRLGKKALGLYLPWQFKAGRPFHGGRAWAGMELALRGMSKTFATAMVEDGVR